MAFGRSGFGPPQSCDTVVELDYKFEFSDSKLVEDKKNKVVLSDTYKHISGDVWQLETKKFWFLCECGCDNCSDDILLIDCTLHLVRSESSMHKVVRICLYSEGQMIKSSPVASFPPSGGKCLLKHFNFGIQDTNVKIVIDVLKNLEVIATPKSPIEPPQSQITTLVRNWIETEDFGDVTITDVDGKKFRCQKEFLARRSDVFRLMFSSPMTESRENLVNIGHKGDVVNQLLLFVYTDTLDITNVCEFDKYSDIPHRLYAAAHQYELGGLKIHCESTMAANLSPQSVVKTFRLAKFYHLDKLMAVCVDYLDTHKAELSILDLLSEAMEMQERNEDEITSE